MKKIIALVLALAMIMMVGASFAADETPTNNRTLDGSISISGLEADDTVAFYRVLKFDQNATKTGGWSNDEGFSVSEDKIQKILGLDSDGKPVVITDSNKKDYGIDESLAATIADMAEGASAKYNASSNPAVAYTDVTDAEGKVARTATVSGVADGLYVAIIHPGQAGTVYNPVFVAADYNNNNTNAWTVDLNDSYNPASMAKKGVVTLTKKAENQVSNDDNYPTTVRVGDTLSFTVETTIPEFANNYTDAVFKVTDKLSKGLTLIPGSISVAITGDAENAIPSTAYVKTVDQDNHGYTISFTKDYLLNKLSARQPITITYQATVDSDADFSVNPEENTVTVNFSNSPTDDEGKGVLKDKTNHYSFDIDAELFGEEDYNATEVVKIGVDKDGKELTTTRQLSNQHWVGALQGAEFKLYKDNGSGAKGEAYTNKFYTADSVFVSDVNGRLKLKDSQLQGIRGLDAGVYWLEETNAPAGYVKLQDAVKIEIKTNIITATYTEEINGITVTYDAEELESYSIEIGGKPTANYTMVNNTELGTHPHIKATKGDTVVGKDGLIGAEDAGDHPEYGKLQNIQGVELPSTGGIGTTIFYILGGLLVVGAAVILVARRKAQD